MPRVNARCFFAQLFTFGSSYDHLPSLEDECGGAGLGEAMNDSCKSLWVVFGVAALEIDLF